METIRIIQAEHLALAAVLHGMLHIVRGVRFGGSEPDFRVLNAMAAYIASFPQQFHHPREEKYLFSRLRERHPDSAPLLDRLVREHTVGSDAVKQLDDALQRYQHEGPKRFAAFATAATKYAAFHWDHARVEEFEVIPLAESFLTPDDWKRIDEAFLAHADPLASSELAMRCDDLFRQIVTILPPPTGVVRKSRG